MIKLADFRAFPFRELLGSDLSYNFSRISRNTDERFPQNESVRIENGEPILSPLCANAPGPPSFLRIGELADPAPFPDEVLVRVRAASLNPVDFRVAAVGSELWSYPHVLGVDAAGVIEQVGVNVTDW